MKPKLTLKIDIDSDIENAVWFVKNGKFVDWFLPLDFQYILSKRFSIKEKDKIIAEYTKHIYKIKKKEIEEGFKRVKAQWKSVENSYYEYMTRLFQEHPWPKGVYTGFVSIYFMFPRNIKEKTFYFPYLRDKWNPTKTIAHEMMHFMFFDYIKKKYKAKEGQVITGKPKDYVWMVSESFNNVIENTKEYRNIFKTVNFSKPYPGCEKMYEVMSQQWRKSNDIKHLLDQWF